MGGKTSNESKRKYSDKTYSKYTVTSRKDVLTRDQIVAAAALVGKSFNEFCTEAILEKMRTGA